MERSPSQCMKKVFNKANHIFNPELVVTKYLSNPVTIVEGQIYVTWPIEIILNSSWNELR